MVQSRQGALVRVGRPGWRADVREYTERYLELRRQAFRLAVDVTIELGQIVIAVKAKAGTEFDEWLREVGTTDRTARNYESLARLAEAKPGIIQRWKELGPTKLYRIATLPAPAQKAILRPSEAERLSRATPEEFAKMVAPFVVKKRKVTPDMRAHGLRMKVASWIETLGEANVANVVDGEIRTLLTRALGALEKAAARVRRDVGG